MMRVKGGLLAVAALALMSGCGWESGGGGDFSSWNDSYNWVNFSGVYRNPDGGVLVSGFGSTPATPAGETKSEALIGTGVAGLHQYSGVLSVRPVAPGTLTIHCQGFSFTDDGKGVLAGSNPGTGGTISYATGSWAINLGPLEFIQGAEITANWSVTVGATAGTINPGNTGKSVYSMSVAQTGNRLTFTDNNGARYEGFISGISAPTGGGATAAGQGGNIEPQGSEAVTTDAGPQTGTAFAQFEAEGRSTSGAHVKITGTLSLEFTTSSTTVNTPGFWGDTSATTSTQSNNRMMRATWIEEDGQTADIIGSAG